MKKVVFSLLLAFTLIPTMPFNTASAITSQISLGETELAPGEEKTLGTCFIKANSARLSAEPATCFSFQSDYLNMGCGFETDEFGNTFTKVPVLGQKVSIAIGNLGSTTNTFKSTLTTDLDSDGCYDCTLSDGSKLTYGDCSAGNNIPPTYNGASRILAPIATLLGGLLILF